MTRKAQRGDMSEAPGQDSFLDIAANLVGILIILIMVVGMRTQDAMVDAASLSEQPSQPRIDVETPKAASEALEKDLQLIGANINRQKIEIEYRRAERDKVNLITRAAEQALASRREELDAAQREQYDLRSATAAAQLELEQLHQAHEALAKSPETTVVLSHLPTPMAKTVFGKEIHLRLQHGRLTYVPWDVLVEKLEAEAPNQLHKLKNQQSITETIGPIEGHWMRYTLRRVEHPLQTKAGVVYQQTVELERFVLEPISEHSGDLLDDALREGSAFSALLAQHDPQRSTITVWVYPESFGQFRRLKEHLFQRGYLTAARPLPEGHPIGGSPEGARSAAQ